MQVSVDKPQFLKHLQMVEHAVSERSTLPILANVLLQTTEEDLVLTATDLDVGIQCRFPLISSTAEGAVALPAKKLTTIVRELSDSVVKLEAKKNHTAIVNCGPSSFRIPGLPAEDFPSLPVESKEGNMLVQEGALRKLIEKTGYAMSMEETRFILNGALLEVDKDVMIMVATDGRRLAIAKAPLLQAAERKFQVVIPAKTVRELGRLLGQNSQEEVAISTLQDNQVLFRFGRVTIITRIIEGQFPQYQKVVPERSDKSILCDRIELMNAIRRASLMTTATSQAVVFDLSENKLVVLKESPDIGSAREELFVEYKAEPMTIAFNPDFWIDVLKVLTEDQVEIEVSGKDKPAVIRHPELTYIVLPMKIH